MKCRFSFAFFILMGVVALVLLGACQATSGGGNLSVGRNSSGREMVLRYSASEMASFPYTPGPSACEDGARPLRVEHQSGSCSGNQDFENPTEYNR